MKWTGIVGVHTRKRRGRGRVEVAPAPDHLKRDFTASRPNQRWVADLCEFPTGEGKLHVAGIRDLCHRGLVGWSMGLHADAELVVDALIMALGRANPDAEPAAPPSEARGVRLRTQRERVQGVAVA